MAKLPGLPCIGYVNPKQAGIFVDCYGREGGGQILLPLCNFCFNSPIDLKFVIYIVHGKISRYREKKLKKIARKLLKTPISAFLSTRSIETGPSQEMP